MRLARNCCYHLIWKSIYSRTSDIWTAKVVVFYCVWVVIVHITQKHGYRFFYGGGADLIWTLEMGEEISLFHYSSKPPLRGGEGEVLHVPLKKERRRPKTGHFSTNLSVERRRLVDHPMIQIKKLLSYPVWRWRLLGPWRNDSDNTTVPVCCLSDQKRNRPHITHKRRSERSWVCRWIPVDLGHQQQLRWPDHNRPTRARMFCPPCPNRQALPAEVKLPRKTRRWESPKQSAGKSKLTETLFPARDRKLNLEILLYTFRWRNESYAGPVPMLCGCLLAYKMHRALIGAGIENPTETCFCMWWLTWTAGTIKLHAAA